MHDQAVGDAYRRSHVTPRVRRLLAGYFRLARSPPSQPRSLPYTEGMFRRRTLLVLTIAGIAPAILLITTLTGSARERRQRLAEQWAARGAHDLAAGQSAVAAEDYRAAQEYAHDHHEYRLQLAQALVAAGRTLEARSELETLWSEAPGNGLINEQLARLAAADGADADAVRFYHAAIDGAWPAGAAAARRQARLELAELLFDRGQRPQAEAELAALLGDSPIDPRAWRLAGRVAFARGDYEAAAARLGAASRAIALDPADAEQLAVSRRVLALDPYARAIGARDRLRRLLRTEALAVLASIERASVAAYAGTARRRACSGRAARSPAANRRPRSGPPARRARRWPARSATSGPRAPCRCCAARRRCPASRARR